LLNIAVEFTAEELEDAIITPNATLDDVHMPLLKVGSWLLPVGLWGFWVKLCCSFHAGGVMGYAFCFMLGVSWVMHSDC
jgi:hypothetical protein